MERSATWHVLKIREDDYGCEERPDDWEPRVLVTLAGPGDERRCLRVEDRWLRERGIGEGSPWPEELPDRS